jgi:hypothetical protein
MADSAPVVAASPVAEEIDPRLPLVVGVTGHRDLSPKARPALIECVVKVLLDLKTIYPNSPLLLLSPLAEGADRLVAEVALRPAITARLMVPMPMPRALYESDFKTAESRAEFARLLAAASQSLELPLLPDTGPERIEVEQRARDRQYMAVGEFVARYSHFLIALWDGKAGSAGGTADVVALKLTGNWAHEGAPDEVVPRGPVFHIVTPRERDGARHTEVRCKELYPADDDRKTAEGHSVGHLAALRLLDNYNREVSLNRAEESEAAERAAADLIPGIATTALCQIDPGLEVMRRQYAMADALAGRYRAKTISTLFWVSLVALLGAFSFDMALHLLIGERMAAAKAIAMFSSPVLGLVAIAIYRRARRNDYQNKYQDYRALAEGLRVQFFWRLAGLTECVADHYLGRYRAELEWISDACRSSLVAARCALGQLTDDVGRIVRGCWIDPQQHYLESAIAKQKLRIERFERRTSYCLRLSLAVILWLAVMLAVHAFDRGAPLELFLGESSLVHGLILVVITMSAGIAALIHNYVEKLALIPQVHMYESMARTYRRYAAKLNSTPLADYHAILFQVGREALMENADWVMTHRQRPLDVPHH